MSTPTRETDFELIFENVSFPLTKAELIHKAKLVGVSLAVLDLINCFPSRFYHSKDEVINQFITRICKVRNPYL